MHQTMIIVQLIGTIFAFWLMVAIFTRKESKAQKLLSVGLLFVFIDMVGYYLELTTDNISAMMIAVRMEYLGHAMGSYLLFLFLCRYSKIKYNFLKGFFGINNSIIFFAVLTSDYQKWYYVSTTIKYINGYAYFSCVPGPLYKWFGVTGSLLGVVGIIIAIQSFMSHKGEPRGEYRWFMIASFIPVACPLFYRFKWLGEFDLTPLGLTFGALCFFIIMQKYGLFDAVAVAQKTVLKGIDEGILVTDERGKLTYYNQRAVYIFPELLTHNWQGADLENFFNEHRSGFERKLPLKIVYPQNVDAVEDAEELRVFRWGEEALTDRRGQYAGKMYTVFDYTDDFRYTRKLIELRNEAIQASEAKSAFLANMSHEIRTPINAVLGMNEMILRETDSETIKDYARNIQYAGKTLLTIINDILDLSKIASGKMEIVECQYHTRTMINDMINMVFERAENKGLNLVVKVDPEIPRSMYGDEIRIKQIVLNLLTNAIKYTEKGKILFEIEKKIPQNINAINSKQADIIFRVSDTGIGIAKEDIERLFESFERLEIEKNHGIEGTGLGLHISKVLAELMKGTLQVESEIGKGSIFTFSLPQSNCSKDTIGEFKRQGYAYNEQNRTEKVHKSAFNAPDARILVVDDNRVNLAVVKGLLKGTMMQIETAASGKEGLALMLSKKYDVVLMDHMMPEMDGVEVYTKWRQELENTGELSTTIVIALTANAVSGAKEFYMENGFNDFLSKPIEPVALEEMILKYLPNHLITYRETE